MKRKIIALVLTVVLCAGSLIGCGSGDNYFTELDKTIKHIGNTTESTVKIKVPKEAFVDASAMPIDVSNGLDATLKVLTQSDDKGNGSCDIDIMLNGDDEYADFTTIVKYGNYLYIQTDSILSFLKEMGADPKGETESQFKQMGMEKAAKLDIKQTCKMLDIDYDEDTFNIEKYKADLGEYIGDMADILEKYYGNLSAKEGSAYTVKIDKNNVSKAIDDTINFIDKDLKEAYDLTKNLVEDLGGKKAVKNYPKYKEFEETAKAEKDSLKESKKDAAKNFGDCVVKSTVSSKDKMVSLSGENFDMEGYKITFAIDLKSRDDNVDIKDSIPENAMDITALIKQFMSMADSTSTGAIQ